MAVLSVGAASAAPTTLDVAVESVQGEVRVTVQSRRLDVHKGDVVPLPATIYTGPSGSIELRQGNTTLSAAPNSELVIPAPAVPGQPIDHIIQLRGNAFYNVAKREASKLHVESAYLVAVIKGTQFSVVVQDDSSAISLFEGRLEVRATDGSDVVDLKAGEIAIRHASDRTIRMLSMNTGEPVSHRAPARSPSAAPGNAGAAPAGYSNSNTVAGDAGNASRSASADSGAVSVGSESTAAGSLSSTGGSANFSGGDAGHLGSGSTEASAASSVNPGGNANPGSGSTDVSSGVAAKLANNSGNVNSGSNPNAGNGRSVGNGNGQGPSNNGNGQGASSNGNGQNASNSGNGQGISNNGNGQGASNNGNGQNGSNNGNGQSASNNGNGQNGSNNGNGQSASNNGNGQSGTNNGNGHGGSNRAASARSPSLVSGSGGLVDSGALSRAVATSVAQSKGTNLGTGDPVGSAANSNPIGGLLGAVTRHKGSPGQP